MYLHLGNQVIALQKSVIGVFDMDTATWSHRTRETLEKLEQAGQMITGSCGLFHSGSFPSNGHFCGFQMPLSIATLLVKIRLERPTGRDKREI